MVLCIIVLLVIYVSVNKFKSDTSFQEYIRTRERLNIPHLSERERAEAIYKIYQYENRRDWGLTIFVTICLIAFLTLGCIYIQA